MSPPRQRQSKPTAAAAAIEANRRGSGNRSQPPRQAKCWPRRRPCYRTAAAPNSPCARGSMSHSGNPILVTGASGFVGSAVARALVAEGHSVRVLVRPNSDRRNVEGLGVEIRTGSLEDGPSLRAAVKGCAALFHVAADYRLWVPEPAAMFEANVGGTRRIMEAALDAGVERIVHTSSVATLGIDPSGRPADETTPVSFADMVGPYKQSKFRAEEAVRGLIAERGLPA